jgi:CHAD domain-containing protein
MPSFKEWFTSDDYKELCRAMQEAQDKIMKALDNDLSQEMVSDIRHWRVGDGPEDTTTHSWRGVARLFAEKYPEFSNEHGIEAGNQISGMQLCDAAMVLLKQKPEEGWN